MLIGQNQERTTRWSLPQRAADGIGAVTGGSPSSIVHFMRAGFALITPGIRSRNSRIGRGTASSSRLNAWVTSS